MSRSAFVYLLLAVQLGVASLCAGCGKGQESPDRNESREDWTHAEMREHLGKKGLKYKAFNTNSGAFSGPAMLFAREGSAAAADAKAARAALDQRQPDVVYCQIRKTAQEARDAAGTGGGEAFASGRFLFVGNADTISKVRAALR